MTEPILLPCPFCGTAPKKHIDNFFNDCFIYCPNEDCGINPETHPHVKPAESIAAWNRRSSQWISVKDSKKPEPFEPIWLWNEDETVESARCVWEGFYDNVGTFTAWKSFHEPYLHRDSTPDFPVTHWQPLPSPPEDKQ
jgi:hypothetical protein